MIKWKKESERERVVLTWEEVQHGEKSEGACCVKQLPVTPPVSAHPAIKLQLHCLSNPDLSSPHPAPLLPDWRDRSGSFKSFLTGCRHPRPVGDIAHLHICQWTAVQQLCLSVTLWIGNGFFFFAALVVLQVVVALVHPHCVFLTADCQY